MSDSKLATFLRVATPEQRQRCAELAGTSVSYLYQLAAGPRSPSVKLAVAIERSTRMIHEETGGQLPVVEVYDLAQPPEAGYEQRT